MLHLTLHGKEVKEQRDGGSDLEVLAHKVNDFADISGIDVDGFGGNFNFGMDWITWENMLDNKKKCELEAAKLLNWSPYKNHVEHMIEDINDDVSLLPSTQIPFVDINTQVTNEYMTRNTESSYVSNIATNDSLYVSASFNDCGWSSCTTNSNMIFEEFVYPKGDSDAITLSKKDVDLLQPNIYINDTIIDFYTIYLKNKLQENEKDRFHFFNSFFFRKLADMDKISPNSCDGKSAFLRVRKWTRKVNLFEKDYIFIPVNFNLHWSLIVICHPAEVLNINDRELEKALRIPCILHLDSIKGYHSNIKDVVRSYLWEEWKERKKETCGEDLSSKFLNMPFFSIEVPQQENSYDCGIFLLHYLELFLAEAPFNFNPLKITKLSNFLNLDWFPPEEAYRKRNIIRKLIFELVENHKSHEGIFLDNCDDQHCVEHHDNTIDGQSHLINQEAATSQFGRGIEMDPSFDASSIIYKEHFVQEAPLENSFGKCQYFDPPSSNHWFNGSTIKIEEETTILPQSSCSSHDSNGVEISNIKSVGNKYWYHDLFYQGTPTLQLNQVIHAVDNKVIDNDVRIIEDMKACPWVERPAKKRQLIPLPRWK
ncbi:probable ubiquitin-like-specific protease 2A [Vicia villosa]|uniref:probable ubiquitin-like-specific protease 2A n=1 Tax=Vicia villosa TaxID=3911 RepID=UPI00273B984F|nr:probable ubiquitin-like-specific protease 2A [Vicia villosa]